MTPCSEGHAQSLGAPLQTFRTPNVVRHSAKMLQALVVSSYRERPSARSDALE